MKKVLKVRIQDSGKVVFDNLPEALEFLKDLQLEPSSEILTEEEMDDEVFNNMKEFEQ